ncbi:MarR family transcriptional regulator [Aeromicrobium ginsengisoli]|uniref:MarR family transcriptional regulator n=1 Tax=Aeromicrobium ginsengisoli TaxID=363867 RepID=A0A5M4FHJ9_9ACTN|nr:MarR family transcriptional regulator [Aeromicrobium ginsengisoli]KAA1399664.1 MarR family transcriptional regulator [Aeromicrobium ginsengisoli]
MASIADRIIAELRFGKPLDDDVLAKRLGVSQRQSINIVARRLESQGVLKRYVGVDGKIVNDLDVDAAIPERRTAVAAVTGDRVSEDEVKTALKAYLEADGYHVEVAWGRTQGIDIDATRPGSHLIIEAKGEAPAGAQQVNYFLGALGELLQRMGDAEAEYGLALPDHRQYIGLVDRLPALARERLHLRVWFVGRSGNGLVVREA